MKSKRIAIVFFLFCIILNNINGQNIENTINEKHSKNEIVLPKKNSHNIFTEYIFSPALGYGMYFDLGNFKDKKPENLTFNPMLKFDVLFVSKSGFSFIILNDLSFPIVYDIFAKKIDLQDSGYPVWNYGLLLGYTHGVKTDLEITAAIGLGACFIIPEIIAQLNISKFFTEKYGIYFSFNNKFLILPKTISDDKKNYYAYSFDTSAGAAFRIFHKDRTNINRKKTPPKKHKPLFEQYVFIPEFSMSSIFIGVSPNSIQGLGPAIGLDMIFTKINSGFSFFIHNTASAWFTLPKDIPNYKTCQNSELIFIPVTVFHFLFGYTYGCGTNFEFSTGIGPALGFVPLPQGIGLSTEFTITKYFSKKYGITFSALNSFTFVPFGVYYEPKTGKRSHSFLFVDILNINIGAAFRL